MRLSLLRRARRSGPGILYYTSPGSSRLASRRQVGRTWSEGKDDMGRHGQVNQVWLPDHVPRIQLDSTDDSLNSCCFDFHHEALTAMFATLQMLRPRLLLPR